MNIYVVARSALKQQPETCYGYIVYNLIKRYRHAKFILALHKYNLKS